MAVDNKGMTRRDVLAGLVTTAAAATVGGRRVGAAAPKVKVVRVESARVWKGDVRDPEVVGAMVTRGLLTFTGESRLDVAWRQFVKPGMRVGLKINLLGRPLVYTAKEMTDSITAGMILAGVKPADIIVWDRHGDHFGPTDYKPGTGAHGERIQVGARYSATKVLQASGGSAPMDTIACDDTDITVNLPVLKDHGGSGVTGALKNIAFGCYNHHRSAHNGNCDPFIAEAVEHFVKTTKSPLIILDATKACFDGGPDPRDLGSIWRENAIYVASDPVALDVVCRQLIMDKRRAEGRSDKTPQCRHIETAASKGLGIGDPALIDVVTVRV